MNNSARRDPRHNQWAPDPEGATDQDNEENKMTNELRLRIAAVLLTASGLLIAVPGYCADRKEARDTRQEGRDEARDTKDACKEGDASRADCRQDKRDDKQDARDEARDVKR
jgi:hypothetical protein